MKRIFSNILMIVTISMFFTGCVDPAYKISDEDLKKRVLETTREKLRNILSASIYRKLTSIKVDDEDLGYKLLKEKSAEIPRGKEALVKFDQEMSELELSFIKIHNDKIESAIEKSYYSATICAKWPECQLIVKMKFITQVTRDGNFYVEITSFIPQ